MHNVEALRRALDYSSLATPRKTRPKKWAKELERRRAPRYPYRVEGSGTVVERQGGLPLDIPPEFPVIALTLSRTGAGFLANYDFKLGDILELVLPAAHKKTKSLRLKVVRKRRAGLQVFEIGGEFADILDD
jgi:hypothetical protein